MVNTTVSRSRATALVLAMVCACVADDPMPVEDTDPTGEPEATTDPMEPDSTGTPGDSSGGEGSGGSTIGSTGPTDEDTGPTEDTGAFCEVGQTLADEVVMIGDSYLAITTVPTDLFEHARLAGSLGPGEAWRRYDQGGTQMGNGQIPGQFQQALAEDPVISTVVMTGGGNDVLLGSANGCLQNPPPGDPDCVAELDMVLAAAEALLMDMAEAGVQDVVYFFYPHLPDWGLVQGAKNETLDYTYPLVEALCDSAPLNCVFVDTRDAFAGHEDEYFIFDGVHPNGAGSAVIAQLVWDAMVEHCIAQ